MKKKLLLMIAMIVALVCLFAISVSAEEATDANGIYYSTSNEFGTINIIDGYNYASNLSLDQRVVLKNGDGTYSTFPMAYLLDCTKDTRGERFQYITPSLLDAYNPSTDDTYTYTYADIIRMEIPEGITVIHHDDRTNIFDENSAQLTGLLEVTFPSTLSTYTRGSFLKGCTALVKADLSKSTKLTSVPSSTFYGCIALTDVTLPSTLTSIASETFRDCTSLVNVAIPSGVKNIYAHAFYSCSSLTNIVLPDVLTNIANNSFQNCSSLGDLIIPASVTSIGTSAFNSAGIGKLTFAAGSVLSGVGKQAFYGTSITGSLILPDAVTSIGEQAFQNCDNLTYVDMPAGLTSVYGGAFNDCDNLYAVNFSRVDQNFSMNWGMFYSCDELRAVSLPEGLKVLGNRMFASCKNLEAVYMPDSITTFDGNSGDHGVYTYCNNVYFVNEPFDVSQYLVDGEFSLESYEQNKPQKPTVYYMPKDLVDITSKSTTFRDCYNINDVIVFDKNLTVISNDQTFRLIGTNGAKAVVFLGAMTSVKLDRYNKNITFYFANEANKSVTDTIDVDGTVTNVFAGGNTSDNNDSYIYFCHSENCYSLKIADITTATAMEAGAAGIKTHINGEFKVKDADCTTPESTTFYCFCGKEMGTEVTSPALGHTHEDAVAYVSINYNGNYLANGYYVYVCSRCSENYDDETADAPALFTLRGYSHATGAIMQGFAINKEAFDEYVDLTKKDVKYGILAASGNVTNIYSGGFNDKVINVDFTNRSYDIMEMKIYGITSATQDTQLYCCGYIEVDGGIIYMDEKMASDATLPTAVSYAGLGGTFAQTASLEATVPNGGKEE